MTGVVKDVSGTVKDVTGIRKDLADTKLADLTIEEKTRLIQPATFDDVKTYDPKVGAIERAVAHQKGKYPDLLRKVHTSGLMWVLVVALALYWVFSGDISVPGSPKLLLYLGAVAGFLWIVVWIVTAIRNRD